MKILGFFRNETYGNLRKLTAFIALAFIVLIGTSLTVDLRQIREHTRELAKMEALTTFNKDQAFRFWATNHGGVYVPPSEATPPNPYLSHIPDRDIELPSGKRLTLMNPAYIMKQAMAEYSELYGVKGHITSLKPLNPANKPDEWERRALLDFENGKSKEKIEFTKMAGQPYLRFMQPMITQEGCLKCHIQQGYKIGDVRGGVSVSLPMAPFLEKEAKLVSTIISSHLIVLLLGMGGIGLAYYRGKVNISERLKTEESIRSKEERFRDLVETTNDMIWEVDASGVYTYVSPKVRTILGYEPEELIGRTPFELMPPNEAERIKAVFIQKVASVEPFTSLENANIAKDGRIVMLETNGMPFFDKQGNVLGYRGIDRDITGRKKAEEELKKAFAEVNRSNDDLQQFAFIVSHDLQEPLRMVSSYMQLLSRKYRGRLDAEADEFIGYAVDGSARMDQMIKSLLEFSRVQSAAVSLREVDSAALLNEALANLAASVTESGASIRRGFLPLINADPAQFVRLLQNLIGNAIKFRRPAEPPVIEVNARESGDVWLFSIKDNGMGIGQEYIERIFEIFQRVHGRKYPGTGIGLAICKKIVERHGGKLWVESEPEKGSTFWFTLPKNLKKQIPS